MRCRLPFFITVVLAVLFSATSCKKKDAEIGTAEKPIQFFLLPSVENEILEQSGAAMKDYLEKHTPYKFRIGVPTNYISVIEAFGSKRADVASLNTFGYLLAHQKYDVDVRLTIERSGESKYQSAIIVNSNSKIEKLSQLNNKKFAYVDPTSSSGYILPAKLLKDANVHLKESVFAQRHDNVISMVYQGQVDAGAIYYSPPINGDIQDARRLVRGQYKDVEKRVKIIGLSQQIPNDAIVFRKDIPEKIKTAVTEGLISFVSTPDGKAALEKTFTVTGFIKSSDKDYDVARKLFGEMGVDLNEMVKKK